MCPLCRQSWPGRLSVDLMLHDHFVLDRNSDGEGETTHLFMYHLALGTEWDGSLPRVPTPHSGFLWTEPWWGVLLTPPGQSTVLAQRGKALANAGMQ